MVRYQDRRFFASPPTDEWVLGMVPVEVAADNPLRSRALHSLRQSIIS